jgi:hypothetical protein
MFVLGEECLFIHGADLDVVDAFHIRKVRVNASVGERPILGDR